MCVCGRRWEKRAKSRKRKMEGGIESDMDMKRQKRKEVGEKEKNIIK